MYREDCFISVRNPSRDARWIKNDAGLIGGGNGHPNFAEDSFCEIHRIRNPNLYLSGLHLLDPDGDSLNGISSASFEVRQADTEQKATDIGTTREHQSNKDQYLSASSDDQTENLSWC